MGVGGDHWIIDAAWVVGLTFCWFCVGGAFHEASHDTLFKNSTINRLVGQTIGVMIGIPYTVYKETHRRHHAYLNTAGDYELWPYSDPTVHIGLRRVFVWLDLVFGVVTAPWIYGRIYFNQDARLKPDTRRRIAREYIFVAVFWATMVGSGVLLLNARGYDWSQFRFIWLLPLLLSPVVNTARKFVEHLGLTSEDPVLGTRTVAGGNLLSRSLRYLNFDISVHGPHHRYPKASPEELPERLQDYQKAHPERPVPVFPSYTAAFLDVLPCLWNNPATGSLKQPAGHVVK